MTKTISKETQLRAIEGRVRASTLLEEEFEPHEVRKFLEDVKEQIGHHKKAMNNLIDIKREWEEQIKEVEEAEHFLKLEQDKFLNKNGEEKETEQTEEGDADVSDVRSEDSEEDSETGEEDRQADTDRGSESTETQTNT